MSRREPSQPTEKWNPFRHVWLKRHERSQSWDAEAQARLNENNELCDAVTNSIKLSLSTYSGNINAPNENERASEGITNGDEIGLRKRRPNNSVTPSAEPEAPIQKTSKSRFKTVHPKEPFTLANQIQRRLLAAWVNVLLVCVPAGIVVNNVVGPSLSNFIVNFVAIIPLFFTTDLATDEISKRLGQNLSNFLSISIRLVDRLLGHPNANACPSKIVLA